LIQQLNEATKDSGEQIRAVLLILG